MPVIKTDDFYIGLNFERSVDVTWNRFSSSIWDVLTGFGGSVSSALTEITNFGKLIISRRKYLSSDICHKTYPLESHFPGEQWSYLAVDFNAVSSYFPGKVSLSVGTN